MRVDGGVFAYGERDIMAITTLRQMRQVPHTEIDDSFKSDLLGALGGSPKFVCLTPLTDEVFLSHLK